ncbi:FMN-binding protein [candidate division WOR-3 bacterium]|nr:FMN-binding protein [candidate division WOR-3 bacterium]
MKSGKKIILYVLDCFNYLNEDNVKKRIYMKRNAKSLFIFFFLIFIFECVFCPGLPCYFYEIQTPDSGEIIYLQKLFPSADSFNKTIFCSDTFFTAREGSFLCGYAFVCENEGLLGSITSMTGISANGICSGILVISHNETPQYFNLLEKRGFFEKFKEVKIDSLDIQNRDFLDYEIDAVTGATVSSSAVIQNFWEAAIIYKNVTDLE